MTSILLVGAASRLGSASRPHLGDRFDITGLVRTSQQALPGETLVTVEDYFMPPPALLAVDCIVNFAGIGRDAPKAILEAANVEGPLRLARTAKAAGAKQFVSISSSHVYGRAREIGAKTPEHPVSRYGMSKKQADAALLALQDHTFTVTILRIPMVYGPGLGESFRQLARLMARTGMLPSPLTPVRRSLLHSRNFAHALRFVAEARIGGIVRIADPEPLSFALLANLVAARSGHPVRLVRWPNLFLRPLLALAPALHDRLYADCIFQQEDCLAPATPYPVTLRQGLEELLST